MAFDNGVSSPGAASFAAPLLDFSEIGKLPSVFRQAGFDEQKKVANDQAQQTTRQQQQLNDQQIAQGQRQAQLAQAFPNGLPIDPKTGQVDYAKAAQVMAKFGDVSNAVTLLGQQPPPQSPMLSGGGQPAQAQPQAAPPQGAVPAQTSSSPKGDAGSGTIASIVTDRLPGQDATTGTTIGKIAQTMGLDPNANLTPGQLRRAQGLLQKYAPEDASGPSAGGQGNLPPSANAISPAPPAAAPRPAPAPSQAAPGGQVAPPAAAQPGAPIGAGSPQPQQQPGPVPQQMPPQVMPPQPQGGQPPPQQVAQPQPQQSPQGQPLTPQVPLPKGFTDPQAAILALRAEAAKLSSNPRGAGQARELDNWASRIEESLKPVSVGPSTTLVDPRTGQPIYQGPGAALMSGAGARSETLQSDAEVYRQTGKLPPNMGRGIQGNAEAHAIRETAREQEIAEGGNPAEWPNRWQSFATQAAGKRALETRAAGLSLAENEASSLIPRVREISGKIERTKYPTINSLILASQKGSGGTDVIKLGIAIESLVPVYARVLKPVGQVGQGDMARAHDILDKAWSDGQINAALDQMQVELKSARSALDKTMSDSENRGRNKKSDGADKAAPADGAQVSPDGFSWKVIK